MKKLIININKLWQDKNCNLAIKTCFLLLTFNFTFLFFNFPSLSPQIPLFYSRPWGEEQLANPGSLLLLPVGGLLVALINAVVASFLFEEFPFLVRILVWSTVLISLLISIAIWKVITLVI